MEKRLIQLIHVGKSALSWDDETYRAVLYRISGKSSSSLCTDAEGEKVLAFMKEKGFEPTAKKSYGKKPRVAASRQTVLNKIEALLCERDLPWAYAEQMAKHMFKKHVIMWLDDIQLRKLMQALIVDAKRRNKRGE